jgi:dynein light chain roadblock-type
LGVIIVNSKGISLRSTMNMNDTIEYGSLISSFANNASRQIKENLHEDEEVVFIRIRSKKHEIMIAPDKEF